MNRFDEMMNHLTADQSVPDEVKVKFTRTLQELPDHSMASKRQRNSVLRRVSVIAAALLLAAGSVYAMDRGGLFGYLSRVIAGSSVQNEVQEVTEVTLSSPEQEDTSYPALWNITSSWTDGAKVYFEATVPEKIAQDKKLDAATGDHCLVNGQDRLLNCDVYSEAGKHFCSIDVSDLEGASSYEIQIKLMLLRNQYNWDEYFLSDDPNSIFDYDKDVTLEAEQVLSFVVSGDSFLRTGVCETIAIEDGEAVVKQALLAPSTLHLAFTYRLTGEQAEERIENYGIRAGFFYIEDADGNRMTDSNVGGRHISEAYTDEEGYLCRDYEIDAVPLGRGENGEESAIQLSVDTPTLRLTPYNGEWNEEGKYIPGTDAELGWGSFTISFPED